MYSVESQEALLKINQAQPKKSKINGDEEAKYHEKLVARAEIIVAAASRLWGELLLQVPFRVELMDYRRAGTTD